MSLIPAEVRQGASGPQWPSGMRAIGMSGRDDDNSIYNGIRAMLTSSIDLSLPPLYLAVSLNNSTTGNEFHHAYNKVKLSRRLSSEPLDMAAPSDPRAADFDLTERIVGFLHIPLKGFFAYPFNRSGISNYHIVNLSDEALTVTFGATSQTLPANSPAGVAFPKNLSDQIPASDSDPNLGYLTRPWNGAFKRITAENSDGDLQLSTRFFVEAGNIPIVAFYKQPPSDQLEIAVLSSVYSVATFNRYQANIAFWDYFEPWLESNIGY